MECFWRNWQDMASRSWRNYLAIYGATYIGVASQTSNNMNIPFIRKRNIWLGYLVALDEVDHWNVISKGWEQGSLEHGKRNMLKFKSNEVLENQTSGKNEKTAKKKRRRKPGCHKPTPLRINLVLEIWLLREPSQTYRPSETCCFSDFLFTAYCSHGSNPIYLLRGFTSPDP